MSLFIDAKRGQEAARLLVDAFETTGIHGQREMPEDLLPAGVAQGSLEHVLFITLTVTIDYMRDANALWDSSRRTYEDAETRYLFDPEALHLTPFKKIVEDMQRYKLSKKPEKDALYWRTVGVSFLKKWQGDPRNFLRGCDWDAVRILEELKTGQHVYNQRMQGDFLYLRGDKIGPLWMRMLRDNVGIGEIRNLDRVPIPVDVHVARASLALGVVRGVYDGGLGEAYGLIRRVWAEGVKGLEVDGRRMIALDVDEPLWHLSKYGCTDRDKDSGKCPHWGRCEAREYCVKGEVVVNGAQVRVRT